jgi:hypothetical protein
MGGSSSSPTSSSAEDDVVLVTDGSENEDAGRARSTRKSREKLGRRCVRVGVSESVKEAARIGLPEWRVVRRREVAADLDAVSAAVRAGRWTRYPAMERVDAEWLAAQRVPGRLGWPHRWKARAKAHAATGPEAERTEVDEGGAHAATPARGESRKRLRRASAQPDAFSYDQSAPKRARRATQADASSTRKRKIRYMDERDGRGRALKRMIQMGTDGIRAIEREEGRGGNT